MVSSFRINIACDKVLIPLRKLFKYQDRRSMPIGNSPRCTRVYHTADLCFILFLRASRTSLTLSGISISQANAGAGVLWGLRARHYKLRVVAPGGGLRSVLKRKSSPAGAGAYNALTGRFAQKPRKGGASMCSLSGSWASPSLSAHQFSN